MEDFFATLTGKDIGLGLLVGIAILMVFRGLLVPVRYYDQMERNKDAQIAQWMQTAKNFEVAYEREREQKTLLLERDSLAEHTLQEIRDYIREGRSRGGDATS